MLIPLFIGNILKIIILRHLRSGMLRHCIISYSSDMNYKFSTSIHSIINVPLILQTFIYCLLSVRHWSNLQGCGYELEEAPCPHTVYTEVDGKETHQ